MTDPLWCADHISKRTTRRILKQMGYSSRRPYRVPLMSAKNRKRKYWTIEDWKNIVWFDESRYLLWHSDGRVRIWHKEHESMDPPCLVSTVQAGGGGEMVWGIFYLAKFGPLSTKWALFICHSLPEYCFWPCPSLYDYSVPIFWWLLPDRIMHHVTKIKSSQTSLLNMTRSSLYSNDLHSHQISIQ